MRHIQRKHHGIGIPFNQNDSVPRIYRESGAHGGRLSSAKMLGLAATTSLLTGRKHDERSNLFYRNLPIFLTLAEIRNLRSQIYPRSQGIPIATSSLGGFAPQLVLFMLLLAILCTYKIFP